MYEMYFGNSGDFLGRKRKEKEKERRDPNRLFN